jgi:peptidoglycan/LPS O-acetylase OafA/YrhL
MKHTISYIGFLDYFRGVAILVVFLFHSLGTAFGADQLPWGTLFRDFSTANNSRAFLMLFPLTYGWAGVAIFFVVSGFCIHLSYVRAPEQGWRTFFLRRFFRIYPPYLVVLIIYGIILPALAIPIVRAFSWQQFLSHLFLVHNFQRSTLFGINPALWSIAVEVQLYALYPLLLLAVSRWGWYRSLLALGCVEASLRLVAGVYVAVTETPFPTGIFYSPFIFWYSWSMGAWIADSYARGHALPFAKTSVWLWLLLAVLTRIIKPLSDMSFMFFSIFTAALITQLLVARATHVTHMTMPSPLARGLQYVGVLSYSIYLIHQPLLRIVHTSTSYLFPDTFIHALIIFVLCLAMGVIIVRLSATFYRYIELPSIALGKWIVRRGDGYAVSSTASELPLPK